MKSLWAIVLGTIFASVTVPVMAQQYRTEEFSSGQSHIAMAYSCGVLGQKTGIAPDAMGVVASVMAQGLTAKHSGDLLADALDWWDADGQRLADMGMWAEFCEQPIDNFRRLMSK